MFVYLLLIAVLAAGLLAYRTIWYTHRFWQRIALVPSVAGVPLLGNMLPLLLMRRSVCEHFDDLYRSAAAADAPLVGMHIFMRPALLARDPQLIKRLLVKEFGSFSNRFCTSDAHSDLIGSGSLFFVKNPAWRKIRGRMTPFFTSGKLRQMFGMMAAAGRDLNAVLGSLTATAATAGDGGEPVAVVEVRDLMARYSTDIVASCAFGVEANSLRDANSEFRRHGRAIFEFTLWRALEFTSMFFLPSAVPLFGFKLFSPRSSAFLRESIELAMAERQRTTAAVRNDLIDTLLELREEDKDKVLSPTNIGG